MLPKTTEAQVLGKQVLRSGDIRGSQLSRGVPRTQQGWMEWAGGERHRRNSRAG